MLLRAYPPTSIRRAGWDAKIVKIIGLYNVFRPQSARQHVWSPSHSISETVVEWSENCDNPNKLPASWGYTVTSLKHSTLKGNEQQNFTYKAPL